MMTAPAVPERNIRNAMGGGNGSLELFLRSSTICIYLISL